MLDFAADIMLSFCWSCFDICLIPPLLSRRLVRHNAYGTRSPRRAAPSPCVATRGQPCRLGCRRARRCLRFDDHHRTTERPRPFIAPNMPQHTLTPHFLPCGPSRCPQGLRKRAERSNSDRLHLSDDGKPSIELSRWPTFRVADDPEVHHRANLG